MKIKTQLVPRHCCTFGLGLLGIEGVGEAKDFQQPLPGREGLENESSN